VAPGVVTPGFWDLRKVAGRMPWPRGGDLTGLRCLDIGTMDGFWAFEMAARGASEVVAIDLLRPTERDVPYDIRRGRRPPPDGLRDADGRGRTFATAARLLDSPATLLDLDVFGLDPAVHGRFDLVFMGYVAELLRDPVGALEAVRGVCRGSAIVLDDVSLPLSLLPRPLARVAARPGYAEWFVFNRAGFRRLLEVAGFAVEAESRFLRDPPGPAVVPSDLPWALRARHALGLAGVALALRGRALP
jgi:tRNA (mo5U34)-methyltransferase